MLADMEEGVKKRFDHVFPAHHRYSVRVNAIEMIENQPRLAAWSCAYLCKVNSWS